MPYGGSAIADFIQPLEGLEVCLPHRPARAWGFGEFRFEAEPLPEELI